VKRGIGPMLVMLGLLLGPGYYIVTSYLSGEPGEVFTLTERAARWALPDGTILHFARSQAYRPVEVNLNPDMNRIAFQLTFEFAPAANELTTTSGGGAQGVGEEYQATLFQADQPILRRTLPLDSKAGTSKKVDAGSIEVYYPGSYTFILEGPDVPRVPVSRVTLQVQQKVEPPSMPFVVVGLVLLVVGLALALEPYLPRRRVR
jgi:hypothetical protein